MSTRNMLLFCSLIALGSVTAPAAAEINFSLGIDVAPPPARVEVVPAPRAGFVWAPGYWRWDGGNHVWVGGHWMAARAGYYWAPERWEQHAEERGHHWHFAPGHWEREHGRWERDAGRREREEERRERR
jgi:hypothetical protein